MIARRNGPRATYEAAAGHSESVLSKYAPFRPTGQGRPACELHGVRLVDKLPAGCPLRATNALRALHTYRERAFQRLHRFRDLAGGLADLQRAETCGDCVARLLGRPEVQRIRNAHRSQIHAA